MLLVRQRRASASPSAFPPHRDARAQSTSELLPGVDPAGDPAGQEHPHQGHQWHQGKDPQDSNIRIAPSLPPVEELEQAIAVLCVCLKMAALEKLGV